MLIKEIRYLLSHTKVIDNKKSHTKFSKKKIKALNSVSQEFIGLVLTPVEINKEIEISKNTSFNKIFYYFSQRRRTRSKCLNTKWQNSNIPTHFNKTKISAKEEEQEPNEEINDKVDMNVDEVVELESNDNDNVSSGTSRVLIPCAKVMSQTLLVSLEKQQKQEKCIN